MRYPIAAISVNGSVTGARTIAKVPIELNGGEEEDRTPDLCIANAALSQLSYFP